MIIFENDNRTERVRFDYKRPDMVTIANQRFLNTKILDTILLECNNDNMKDKLLGSILGLAVGDILGCPLEGMTTIEIQKYYGEVDNLVYPEIWKYWRLGGLHSDDTQQALAILEAITLNGGKKETINWDGVCRSLVDIYLQGEQINKRTNSGCWRGTGKGFRTALSNLEKNYSKSDDDFIFSSGMPSAGLGAAMRTPPLGILFSDSESLEKAVTKVSMITHLDPLGISSAYLAARVCSLLKDESLSSFDIENFLKSLYKDLRIFENNIKIHTGKYFKQLSLSIRQNLCSDLIREVPKYLKLDPVNAITKIESDLELMLKKKIPALKGYGPSGVIASLYFFLKNVHDPYTGLFETLNSGGDTDTTGAIVGAMFGSLYGVKAYEKFIPDLFALSMILEVTNNCYNEIPKTSSKLVFEENLFTVMEYNFKMALEKLK